MQMRKSEKVAVLKKMFRFQKKMWKVRLTSKRKIFRCKQSRDDVVGSHNDRIVSGKIVENLRKSVRPSLIGMKI